MIFKETKNKDLPTIILLHGGGLSIGAQIVVEVLSQRENIAECALIESALVYPIKGTAAMTIPVYKICFGLIKSFFVQ